MARDRIIIVFLLVVLVVISHALVRTENQRYAMFVGMCSDQALPKAQCLEKIETRQSWWWHLYYALQN